MEQVSLVHGAALPLFCVEVLCKTAERGCKTQEAAEFCVNPAASLYMVAMHGIEPRTLRI